MLSQLWKTPSFHPIIAPEAQPFRAGLDTTSRPRRRLRSTPSPRCPGEDGTVHDAEHQDEPEDREPAEHGAPRPPHLDAAPARPAVHGRQDDNVDELERDGEARPRNGGFQPGLLLGSRDKDAADALVEGLLDGPDVAVAVEDGEAEGLEDGAAPGDGGGGL